MTQPSDGMRLFRACAAGLAVLALMFAASGCTRLDANATATPVTFSTNSSTSDAPAPPAVLSMDPPLNGGLFAPMTPVVISAGNGTLSEVIIAGADGRAVPGALSTDGAVWQSTELLHYDTTYSVSATAVNADGQATATTGSISTVKPRSFTKASITPFGDMTSVGVGMPIVVTFNEDIEDRAAVERRLAVTATPPVVGSWYWFNDREVHFRPQEYWAPGTHVVLDVGIYG
ncbi:MAG: hypothetical protein H0T54_03000, partial [Geodermatophilaceae bacterium]|nr:hypothetical protein [Geodermatophilaceae bacterium]